MGITSYMVLALAVICAVSQAQVRRGGVQSNQRGLQGALANQRGLTAADRRAVNGRGALNNQRGRQVGLNSNNVRGGRRGQRQRVNQGGRLQRNNNRYGSSFANGRNIDNVDAAYSRDEYNNFELALKQENAYSEDAAFSRQRGNAFNSGTQVAANDAIAAETGFQSDVARDEAVFGQNQLGFNGVATDGQNAGVGFSQLGDSRINANNGFISNNNVFNRGIGSAGTVVG